MDDTIYIELLDKYFIKPKSHPINETKFQKFKNKCNQDIRYIVQKIKEKTMYISFDNFTEEFEKNINKLIETYYNLELDKTERPIYVKLPSDFEDKSNYWLLLYLIDYLNKNYCSIKIQIIMTNEIDFESDDKKIYLIKDNIIQYQDNDIILFLDDCIYSGNQMQAQINKIKRTIELSHKINKINIFLLCSYISEIAFDKLNKIFPITKKRKVKGGANTKRPLIDKIIKFYLNGDGEYNEIPLTNNILKFDEIEKLNEYYGGNEDDNQHNFNNKYLIYFDHKLADSISTITLFYSGVVLNEENKEIITDNYDETTYKKNKTDINLDVIEFIENCDGTYENMGIQLTSPKCPYPPYKKR